MITTKLTIPARAVAVAGAAIIILGLFTPWLAIESDLGELKDDLLDAAGTAGDGGDGTGDGGDGEEDGESPEDFVGSEADAPFFTEDGSHSGWKLFTSGEEFYGGFSFMRFMFTGVVVMLIFAIVMAVLAALGVSILALGVVLFLGNFVVLLGIMVLNMIIGDMLRFDFQGREYGFGLGAGSGLVIGMAGSAMAAVGGGLLRVDKKKRQEIKDRMEFEKRYHNTYRAVAGHMVRQGMTDPDHRGILSVMGREFDLRPEDMDRLESEAGWHGGAPGPAGRPEGGRPAPGGGPPEPGGGAPPPPTPPSGVDPCPSCGGPLEWVDEFGEWYCEPCDSYPFVEKKGGIGGRGPPPKAGGGAGTRGGGRGRPGPGDMEWEAPDTDAPGRGRTPGGGYAGGRGEGRGGGRGGRYQ